MNKKPENNLLFIDFLHKNVTIGDLRISYKDVYLNKDYNKIDNSEMTKELINNFISSLSEEENSEEQEIKPEVIAEDKPEEHNKNTERKKALVYDIPFMISFNQDFININSFIVSNIVITKNEKTIYNTIFPNTIVNIYMLVEQEDFNNLFSYIQDNKIGSVLVRFRNFDYKYVDNIITLEDKMNMLKKIK